MLRLRSSRVEGQCLHEETYALLHPPRMLVGSAEC